MRTIGEAIVILGAIMFTIAAWLMIVGFVCSPIALIGYILYRLIHG